MPVWHAIGVVCVRNDASVFGVAPETILREKSVPLHKLTTFLCREYLCGRSPETEVHALGYNTLLSDGRRLAQKVLLRLIRRTTFVFIACGNPWEFSGNVSLRCTWFLCRTHP